AAAHFTLALLSQGTREENHAKMKEHGIHTVLLQREHEVSDQYDALGTPGAVLVRPDGVIGSPVATGAEAIRSLVSSTINESLAALVSIQLQEGDTAPPMVYPDLEGQMFNLAQLRGKPSIVLFWNPGCGFCQQMADDLKVWEKKAEKAGTQVLLISTGTVEVNRKPGFRSRVLLDQHFTAGKAFGAGGTPSAILLDENGKVASKVAVGKPEILDSIFGARTPAGSRA
ncbi:MAG TPA: TlpA disulfide reductase family protein, partial [Bryobacteraceae bacterium]|nr:TlpA disulfide reductase family protein [Bryobacteraceae bacterium]